MSVSPLAPELMLLAAIERAEVQAPRPGGDKGTRRADIVAHLGLGWHSGTAKRLKAQLGPMEAAGWVELGEKPPERSVVALTPRGLDRLLLARRKKVPEAMPEALPESPQHRIWREAHEAAGAEIDGFRGQTTAAVQDAETALVDPGGASAEELMRIGDRLRREFWRLASATYCREEWPEPDDRQCDRGDLEGGVWLHSPRQVTFWDQEKLLSGSCS
jgi:hypothetical protein